MLSGLSLVQVMPSRLIKQSTSHLTGYTFRRVCRTLFSSSSIARPLTALVAGTQFAQGAGVAAVNSSFIVVANCTISGVGIMGANITGGTNNTLSASSVLDTGNGGINVYAGADIGVRSTVLEKCAL